MEFLTHYGLFLAKTLTLVAAVAVVIGLIVSAGGRNRKSEKGQIEVTRLNEKFEQVHKALQEVTLDPEQRKQEAKAEKKRRKQERAEQKKAARMASGKIAAESADKASRQVEAGRKKRVFVVDFDGDIKASAVSSLRESISAVLGLATKQDEVVVRLESGGGLVHSYGLAASQLERVASKQIPLTVCVDKVAASGGYMMACVADKIIAAPFAIIGSIGVVAQLPNFHKLLRKNDIDYELFTAGEYKRTVTMFGENTSKGREKFTQDLENTHDLFKEFVSEHRPQVDIAEVATGEIWYGRRALGVKLIDQVQTSDEYLFDQRDSADIFEIDFTYKRSLPEKLGLAAQAALDSLLLKWWERSRHNRWF